MEDLPFELELPARRFAFAFLNVSMAAGEEGASPVLYRTACWEVFSESRVRLVSTDGSVLLWSMVDTGWDPEPPELDELPLCQVVAADIDLRVASLCTYLLKLTKKEDAEADEPRTVRVTVESLESDDVPTLAPEVDRKALVVDAGFERVQLPVIDGAFPAWRGLWPASTTRVPGVALGAWSLGMLSKLRPATAPVDLHFTGKTGPVVVAFEPAGHPPVAGLVMPVRAS